MDYATPQGVLNTVVDAVFAHGQGNGLAAYIGAFADTATQGYGFHVDFDPQVVADRINAGKAIPDWNRDDEKSFYTYLSQLDDGEYSLGWVPDTPDEVDETAGVATLRLKYALSSTGEDGTPVVIGAGHAELTLRRLASGTRWVITRWSDRLDEQSEHDPTQPGHLSFSRLRILEASFPRAGGDVYVDQGPRW